MNPSTDPSTDPDRTASVGDGASDPADDQIAAIQGAVDLLHDLGCTAVDTHPERFHAVHRRLQDALTETRPADAAPDAGRGPSHDASSDAAHPVELAVSGPAQSGGEPSARPRP